MHRAVQQLLNTFDSLTDAEKHGRWPRCCVAWLAANPARFQTPRWYLLLKNCFSNWMLERGKDGHTQSW